MVAPGIALAIVAMAWQPSAAGGGDSPAATTPRWSLVVPGDFRARHELGLRNDTSGELAVCVRSLSLEFDAAGGVETGAIEGPSPHSCLDETTSHPVKGGETFLFAAHPELFPTSANPRVSRISVSIYSRCLGPAGCPMKGDLVEVRCVKGTCQGATRDINPCGASVTP